MGAVSLGYGPNGKRIRRKVSGKTKQEVRDKLEALHQELSAGSGHHALIPCGRRSKTGRATGWTVRPSGRARSTRACWKPVLEMVGARLLRELTASDVRSALGELVTRLFQVHPDATSCPGLGSFTALPTPASGMGHTLPPWL
jgi:hypothetical protein